MNNKTSANSDQVTGFSLTIIQGDQSPDRPELLGRDIRYVLNVKAVGQDGHVIEGVRYTVNCDIASNNRIVFRGRGEEQISTAAGENFSIYGEVLPTAGLHQWMNKRLVVIVTSKAAGVSTQVEYFMGRLCYWATPEVIFDQHARHWWVSSHTEWVGEGTAGSWHWSRNVEHAHLNIPGKDIATSHFTHPATEYSVKVDFPFNKEVFNEGEFLRVLMPSSWNNYTATIPYEGVIQVPSIPSDGVIQVPSE